MAGPWEDYAPKAQPPAESGPWADYGSPDAEKDTSFLGALQHGAASQIAGYGATARAAGASDIGKTVQGVGSAAAPDNYETASDKVGLNPRTWGNIPRAVVENSPGLATDLAAGGAGAGLGSFFGPIGSALGGLGGFGASYFARNFGNNVADRVKRDNPNAQIEDATGKDMAIAGGATAAEAALNRVGLKGVPIPGMGAATGALERAGLNNVARGLSGGVDSVTKGAGIGSVAAGLPGQMVGAGAREGALAAAGNIVNQIGRTADTEKGLEINPTEVANSGVLGAGVGAGLRGAKGVTQDLYQAQRNRIMADDPNSPKLAEDLRATGHDTASSTGAGAATKEVTGSYRRGLNESSKEFTGQYADADVKEIVQGTKAKLLEGHMLSEGEFAKLEKAVDAKTPEGAAMMEAARQYNTLNKLKTLGTYVSGRRDDPSSATFDRTGLSGSAVGRALNPFDNAGKKIAGLGGATMLPTFVESALAAKAAAAAPYVAGAATGLHVGMRGVDALLQTKSPVDQFVQRFTDMNGSAPANVGAHTGANPNGPAPTAPPAAPAAPAGPQGPLAGGPARPSGAPRITPSMVAPAPRAPAAQPRAPQPAARSEADAMAAREMMVQEIMAKAKADADLAKIAEGPAPKADVASTAINKAEAEGKLPRGSEDGKSFKERVAETRQSGLFRHRGEDHAIGEKYLETKFLPGLLNKIIYNQDRIIKSFERVQDFPSISPEAKAITASNLSAMRQARTQDEARAVKASILSQIPDKKSRDSLDYHWNDRFFSTWSQKSREPKN